MRLDSIARIIGGFSGVALPPGERAYLDLHARRYAETMALLPAAPQEGSALLDVGVFPGHLAALARARGYQVSGLGNEEMTAGFRERAACAGLELHQRDVELDPFPFDDDRFEAVLFCELIEHLYRNPFHVLAEIFRVLRPGGVLILTTPNLASLDKINKLLHGKTFMPSLRSPLDEIFPLNPNYGHYREYTMEDLRLFLTAQEIYPFRFAVAQALFSSCWDPPLKTILGEGRWNPRNLSRSLVMRSLRKMRPGFRSNLMIKAQKPAEAAWVPASSFRDMSGFETIEKDNAPPDFTRRALPAPFRWTTGRAGFTLSNPFPGRAGRILLQCSYLTPGEAPPAQGVVLLNGREAKTFSLTPIKTYQLLEIPVDRESAAAPEWRLEVASSTWRPRDLGLPDQRELGVMIAWDRLLVLGRDALPDN